MKIAVCGSMFFSPEILEIGEQLRARGHLVEVPAFTEHYTSLSSREKMHSEAFENKIKYNLIREYFEVIKEKDAVLAVNKTHKGIENYVGGNTFLEITFAHILNKKLYLLHPIPQMLYTDEIRAMQPIVINGNLDLIV